MVVVWFEIVGKFREKFDCSGCNMRLVYILTPTGTTDPRAYAQKLLPVAPLVAQMGTRGSLAYVVRINGV